MAFLREVAKESVSSVDSVADKEEKSEELSVDTMEGKWDKEGPQGGKSSGTEYDVENFADSRLIVDTDDDDEFSEDEEEKKEEVEGDEIKIDGNEG